MWRERAPLSGALALALASSTGALPAARFLYKALLFVATAYGVLWLALSPALARLRLDPGGRPVLRHLPLRLAGAAGAARALARPRCR